MSWTEQPIHFVDFEGNRTSGILEFGVATLEKGQVVSARTRLCRASGRIRAEDTAVHGIAEQALGNAAPFALEWEYFADLREHGPLAAHFAGTENSLLKAVWPYPRLSPDFARPGDTLADWGPWIDTGALYAQLYPQLSSGKLETLVADCGLQPELDALALRHCPADRRHYHAALYDALAGALLLAALARDASLAALSTPQLITLSTLDGDKRDALQQRTLW